MTLPSRADYLMGAKTLLFICELLVALQSVFVAVDISRHWPDGWRELAYGIMWLVATFAMLAARTLPQIRVGLYCALGMAFPRAFRLFWAVGHLHAHAGGSRFYSDMVLFNLIGAAFLCPLLLGVLLRLALMLCTLGTGTQVGGECRGCGCQTGSQGA